MSTQRRIQQYFDRAAPAFDAIYSGRKGATGRLWDRLTRRNIADRLRFTIDALSPVAGKRILDAGCGSGRYALELASRGAGHVVGLDLSLRMLALAQNLVSTADLAPVCTFLQQDVVGYHSGTPFDAVVAMGFFDYVANPGEILHHFRTLTAGRLVASFPCLWAWRVPFRKVWLVAQGCPVRFFTEDEVRGLCGDAGFSCTTLLRSGPIYLLIADSSARS